MPGRRCGLSSTFFDHLLLLLGDVLCRRSILLGRVGSGARVRGPVRRRKHSQLHAHVSPAGDQRTPRPDAHLARTNDQSESLRISGGPIINLPDPATLGGAYDEGGTTSAVGQRGIYRSGEYHHLTLTLTLTPNQGSFHMGTLSKIITGPPMGRYCIAHWRLSLSSFVGVYNTPRRACRQRHTRRPGDDVMPPPA